jgi:hypothetical protein
VIAEPEQQQQQQHQQPQQQQQTIIRREDSSTLEAGKAYVTDMHARMLGQSSTMASTAAVSRLTDNNNGNVNNTSATVGLSNNSGGSDNTNINTSSSSSSTGDVAIGGDGGLMMALETRMRQKVDEAYREWEADVTAQQQQQEQQHR